ncbi:hypothetical protein PRK78_004766 [Emydomyces testavorans]|uniref:Uncharacterized protein n=1 Tax=Emydomyces testavorans TaxID=2070801 RepID=A0AAF0DIM3_9EURO|nr:hypothetical protein PRK78_004766 [Emydomyces testavorans]
MPYYIRFLKQPQISKQNGNRSSITTLITITTDLGDSFFPEDVEVIATVQFARPVASLSQTVSWKAGSREQKVTFGAIRRDLVNCPAQFSIRPLAQNDVDSLEGARIIRVVSAWSPWFDASQGKFVEKLVLRRFKTRIGPELKLWEETGNSISRHIWDAALAAIVDFQENLTDLYGKRLPQNNNNEFNALELGSGCGIVGIALAQMLPKCSMMLTDTGEVQDIIHRNISAAQPAENSRIEFRTLDWNEEIPLEIKTRRHDLIFLSDCTYNSDALPALVKTVRNLLKISPAALVLVAWKKRCESELLFFDLMKAAGLAVLGQPSHPLQGSEPESESSEASKIQIYRFQRAKGDDSN